MFETSHVRATHATIQVDRHHADLVREVQRVRQVRGESSREGEGERVAEIMLATVDVPTIARAVQARSA